MAVGLRSPLAMSVSEKPLGSVAARAESGHTAGTSANTRSNPKKAAPPAVCDGGA
jgi:hypothetical protein